MIHDVSHRTTYRYGQPVSISHHVLHLTPRSGPHQTCRRSEVAIDPVPAVSAQDTDYFGNEVLFVEVQEQHAELAIHARSTVAVERPTAPDAALTAPWEDIAGMVERGGPVEVLDALQFAFDSPYTVSGDDVSAYARASFPPGRPVLEAALDLTARIFSEFTYDPAATTVATPVDEVFRMRRGVCQDFAHLELACLRALALPARYVSGYLLTRPPPGQEKKIGADASHAWLSLWCAGHGWIDLDPTNNAIVADEHVTLAWGRDYGDVSPINGVIYGGGEHAVEVAVDVVPVSSVLSAVV